MFTESEDQLFHVVDCEININDGNAILSVTLSPGYQIILTDPDTISSTVQMPLVMDIATSVIPPNFPVPINPVSMNIGNINGFTLIPLSVNINFYELQGNAAIPNPLIFSDIKSETSQLVSLKKRKTLNYSNGKYKHYFPQVSNKPVSKVVKEITNKVLPQNKKKESSNKK